MSAHDDPHNDCARRNHVWYGERCQRCGMKRDWPGAKHACEGVETSSELAARVMRSKKKKAQK